MSKSQTPVGRTEKTMSSRLLTMKFMQRAAAASSTPSAPQTLDGPPSKRRKTSTDPSPITTPSADAQAFQAAADAEEAKRTAAIERIAAEAGETKWVLSITDTGQANTTDKKLQFLTTGYSDIDQDNQTAERQSSIGRRRFGHFSDALEKQQENTTNTASSSSDESQHSDSYSYDEDPNDSTDPTEALIRGQALHRAKADRKGMKKAQEAEAARLAEARRSKEAKLNKLSSISGGGGGAAGTECHFCGQKGHKKVDCPRRAKQKRRKEDR